MNKDSTPPPQEVNGLTVHSAVRTPDSMGGPDQWVVICRRASENPAYPYVVWSVFWRPGACEYIADNGHYDLTLQKAMQIMTQRVNNRYRDAANYGVPFLVEKIPEQL